MTSLPSAPLGVGSLNILPCSLQSTIYLSSKTLVKLTLVLSVDNTQLHDLLKSGSTNFSLILSCLAEI